MSGEPMKPADVRKCDLCGDPLMKKGGVTFFRVTFERMVIDVNAVREIHGLSTFFRSEQLARVFAPSDVIARPLPADVLICCDSCAIGRREWGVFALAQIAASESKRQTEKSDRGHIGGEP